MRPDSSVTLFGGRLERPLLKFDNVVSSSVHKFSMQGIQEYGPYDKNLIPRKALRLAVMYPADLESRIVEFTGHFINGLGRYPGYVRWFRQSVDSFERFPLSDVTIGGYEDVANHLSSRKYDLVFVVTKGPRRDNPIYQRTKVRLLGNGLPSQFLDSTRLYVGPDQLQWILSNISLSTYAKIGGTPWVIEAPERPEIVIGVSRAVDPTSRVIIGFAVVFKQNGDFVLSYSKSPVTTWGEYEMGVEDLVLEAINKYRRIETDPDQIVFHFSKRPGKREIESISKALERLGLEARYALVHLNDSSGFRLFDTSHPSHVPFAGLKVRLSSHETLLLLDGRDPRGLRPFVGTPSVLDVTIDRRSTVDPHEHQRLVDQVFSLAFVNWRGFNARTVPVTTNYAYLIARIASGLESVDEWNRIISSEELTGKAWFL